jgi:glutamate dehydrogenase/leucine dehydrogenase
MVYSGLEEYMTKAVRDHWEYAEKHNLNLRDACMVQSIAKLHKDYEECGISV